MELNVASSKEITYNVYIRLRKTSNLVNQTNSEKEINHG